MHSSTSMLEEHVRAVNARRLEQAVAHKQLRLARAGQPGTASKIIANLRGVTGMWLITLGHRLQNRPAFNPHPTTSTLKPASRHSA